MGLLILAILVLNFSVYAQSYGPLKQVSSPLDLVGAVNALRAAYGLPAYSANSILMLTAQTQADFMASTGKVEHTGPGGSTFTERLLAAGYPLSGDLAQGGFRSENIMAGTISLSAQSAVNAWMGDSAHQNTMLSQILTEIGAGVSVVDGKIYYVIDCARPSTEGALPDNITVVESGTAVPGDEAANLPIVLSTPNLSGDVIHEVQSGQTLWQIAISYGVKIDDIKRLNNLSDGNIYPGNELLIKHVATPILIVPLTATVIPEITGTADSFVIASPVTQATQTQISAANQIQDSTRTASVIAIIGLLGLGAVIFILAGNSARDRVS